LGRNEELPLHAGELVARQAAKERKAILVLAPLPVMWADLAVAS